MKASHKLIYNAKLRKESRSKNKLWQTLKEINRVKAERKTGLI